MFKKYIITLLLIVCPLSVGAVTIGMHGIQGGIDKVSKREKANNTEIAILGMVFDKYGDEESLYLDTVVNAMGTGRIYHISLSPYGYTAKEVANKAYDTEYKRFFEDIQRLQIKVVFRTMHEMNGGRYSRASNPEQFKKAWIHVYNMARYTMKIQSDQLLFSLSFNSQDLPTKEDRPTQNSHYEYCSQWVIDTKGRCPRMEDYYPGNQYVDLVGVTLYNWGRSRDANWSIWKSPTTLLEEGNLITRLYQRNKPISIDELGTTAVNFEGKRTQEKVTETFKNNSTDKNIWIRERKLLFKKYPLIKATVYFNLDATAGATTQVLGQADRKLILSPYITDYSAGKSFLTNYGDDALNKLFVLKEKPQKRDIFITK